MNTINFDKFIQSEEQFRLAAHVFSHLIYEWDVKTDSLAWFGDIDSALGFELSELPRTIEAWMSRIHTDDIYNFENAIEHHHTSTEQIDYEYRIKHKDGSWRYWSDRAVPVIDDGLLVKWIGVCEDITEQKQAQKVLQESLEFNKMLLNSSPDIIYIYDIIETRNVYSNEGIMKVLGYSVEEVQGMGGSIIPTLMHPEDFKFYMKETLPRYQKAKDEERVEHEYRMKHKDGTWHWLQSRESIFQRLSDGTPAQIFGIVRDITEQKNVMEEIEILAKFPSENPNPVLRISKDGIILYHNNASEHLLEQWQYEEGKPLHERWYKIVRVALKEDDIQTVETEIGDKILSLTFTPIEARFVNVYGLDITERKKLEETLNQSERLLIKVAETGKIGGWEMDLEKGGNAIWTKGTYDIAEIEPGESIPGFNEHLDWYLPEYRGMISKKMQDLIKTRQPMQFEAMVKTKKGTLKWCQAFGEVVVKDNKIVKLRGTFQDISTRRQAEEALKKSEERFDLAMDATQDGLFDWNLLTNEIYYSPAWKRMLGYKDDELPNDFSVWESLTDPEDVKRSWEMQQELISKKRDRFEMEFKMKHKDGHLIDILSRASAIFDENYKAVRIVGTHVDITDRKKAEITIEKEKMKAQQYLDIAGTMFIALNGNGEVILANRKSCEVLGYDEEEILGKNWFENFIPEWLRKDLIPVAKQLLSGGIQSQEYHENPILTKSGEERMIAWHNALIKDDEGNIIGHLSSGEDITERMKAIEEIQKLARFPEENPNPVLRISQDGMVKYCNNAGESILEQWCLKEGEPLVDEWHAIVEETLKTKNIKHTEVESGGSSFILIFAPIPEAGFVNVYGLDITDRKKLEEEIQRNKIQLLNAMKLAKLGNWEYDVINDLFTFNDQFYSIFRTSAEEVGGYTMSSADYAERFVHPEDVHLVGLEIQKALETTDPHYSQYLEHRFIDSRGEIGYISVRFVIEKDNQGRTIRTIGANQDITDRKRIELDLLRLKEYNERIIHTMKEGLLLEDQEGTIQFHNSALGKMLGYEKDELVGQSWTKIVPEDQQVKVQEANKRRISGLSDHYELELLRKDGNRILVLAGGAPFLFGETYQGLLAFFTDISDVKKAEERFRIITENSADAIFITDKMGNYVYVNQAASEMLGYTYDELITMNIADISNPEKIQDSMEQFKTILQRGKIYTEIEVLKKDGSYLDVDLNSVLLPNGMVYGSCRDISDRKRLEEELKRTLEATTDAIWSWNFKTNALTFSSRYYTMLGYEPDEFPATYENWVNIIHPDDTKKALAVAEEYLRTKPAFYENEFRLKRKDGDYRWIHAKARVVERDQNGDAVHMIGNHQDISDRRIAEERIRYHAGLLDKISEAIISTDMDSVIMSWNKAAEDMYGYKTDEAIGYRLIDLVKTEYPDSSRDQALNDLKKYGVFKKEVIQYRKDGTRLNIFGTVTLITNDKGKAIGMVGVNRDITERKRLEKERISIESQLRHSQKLEAIGTLAGGVAHEINNPIQGIMGYADIIQGRVGDEKELKVFTDGIKKESQRVATIIKNLLTFARKGEHKQSYARVQDIIDVSNNLLIPVFRKHQITVETNIPEDLPKIKCRSQQIEQVIINLLTNARDALNIKYEGWHENKQILINAQSFQKDGVEWVRTTIEDHGTGIPIEIRDHIFDPFFTTKERGRSSSGMATPPGTGLGLSVSYGIIKDHHGELWVESVEGEYTRFHMDLRVDNGCSLEKPDEKHDNFM